MDVSDMLLASVSLHRSAATAKSESKLELWRHAYEMRKRAHAEDPEHLSPGWAAEQGATPRGRDTHEELMTFYREKLGE